MYPKLRYLTLMFLLNPWRDSPHPKSRRMTYSIRFSNEILNGYGTLLKKGIVYVVMFYYLLNCMNWNGLGDA